MVSDQSSNGKIDGVLRLQGKPVTVIRSFLYEESLSGQCLEVNDGGVMLAYTKGEQEFVDFIPWNKVTSLKHAVYMSNIPKSAQVACATSVAPAKPINRNPKGSALMGIGAVGRNGNPGAILDEVVLNGIAMIAGLMQGDRIIKMDDEDIMDYEALMNTLDNSRGGDSVVIEFIRGVEPRTTVLTYGTRQ